MHLSDLNNRVSVAETTQCRTKTEDQYLHQQKAKTPQKVQNSLHTQYACIWFMDEGSQYMYVCIH